jgi:hypothetical protein
MKKIKMTVYNFKYIYFIKASFCTVICKTENKGCPNMST